MTTHAAETITGYRITATRLERGARVDITDATALGPNLHTLFASREAAEVRASEMQGEVEEFDLAPSTVYAVEECAVVVSEVAYDAAEGVVTARLTGDGYDRSMMLAVEPNHTTAGIDGLRATSVLGLGAGRKWDAEVAAVLLSMVRTVVTERGVEAA